MQRSVVKDFNRASFADDLSPRSGLYWVDVSDGYGDESRQQADLRAMQADVVHRHPAERRERLERECLLRLGHGLEVSERGANPF